jgi:hypothetical protein
MGHAGAIISGGSGTAAEKMAAMRRAGITVVKSPAEMGEAVERLLAGRIGAAPSGVSTPARRKRSAAKPAARIEKPPRKGSGTARKAAKPGERARRRTSRRTTRRG